MKSTTNKVSVVNQKSHEVPEAATTRLVAASSTTFFLGQDRKLRTFWRVLIAYLGFFAVEVAMALGAQLVLVNALHLPSDAISLIYPPIFAVAMLGFVVCLRRFMDHRPWKTIGLPLTPHAIPLFLLGFGIVAVAIGAAAALSIAAGWSVAPPFNLSVTAISSAIVGICFAVLSQAFPEELVFRGYIFKNLSSTLSLWAAGILTAGLFGVLHVFSNFSNGSDSHPFSQQLLWVLVATGLGLLATSVRIASGSIWMSIGVHAGLLFNIEAFISAGTQTPELYGNILLACFGCLFLSSALVLLWSKFHNGPPLSERLSNEPAQIFQPDIAMYHR